MIFFALQAYAPFESKDFEYSYRFDLPIILKSIPVVIYNGNFDLVVDFYGTTEMLDTMIWPGKSGFNSASTTPLPPSLSLSATLAHRTTHSNTHAHIQRTERGLLMVRLLAPSAPPTASPTSSSTTLVPRHVPAPVPREHTRIHYTHH